MGKQYKKPFRKRKPYKMKSKQGGAFTYGIGRQGRAASMSSSIQNSGYSSKATAMKILQRMGFKGGS